MNKSNCTVIVFIIIVLLNLALDAQFDVNAGHAINWALNIIFALFSGCLFLAFNAVLDYIKNI